MWISCVILEDLVRLHIMMPVQSICTSAWTLLPSTMTQNLNAWMGTWLRTRHELTMGRIQQPYHQAPHSLEVTGVSSRCVGAMRQRYTTCKWILPLNISLNGAISSIVRFCLIDQKNIACAHVAHHYSILFTQTVALSFGFHFSLDAQIMFSIHICVAIVMSYFHPACVPKFRVPIGYRITL